MVSALVVILVVAVAAFVYVALNARQRTPQIGERAFGFELRDQFGKLRTLGEFRGRRLVLYFYPRDDTPGCVEQAMRFRDAMRELEGLGAAVCGVSVDSSASHAAFAVKYKLPFPLLADTSGETARRYGSLRNFGFVRFARRNTFVLDAEGRVEKVYLGVNAGRNAGDVVEDLTPRSAKAPSPSSA